MQRSLLRQLQTIRWVPAVSYSTKEVREPMAPNQDYFGRERRASAMEKSEETNAPWFLRAFATKQRKSMELFRFNPKHFTVYKFKQWKARHWRESEIMAQSYVEERHTALGSDLAAANFIVYQGGKVKFVGQDEWFQVDEKTRRCEKLPRKLMKDWYLEAIDASGIHIRYEGLKNVINLRKIKWVSFQNCPNVDNWCVDRITGEMGATLEYLNLSGCTEVTEEVLACMYRCQNLKELVLKDVATTHSFQLGCLLLEDSMPALTISGVDYLLPNPSELTEKIT